MIPGRTGASVKLSKAGVALLDVDPESKKEKKAPALPAKFARKSKNDASTSGLQTHFGIADVRSKPSDIAQTTVLFPKETASNLLTHQTQCRARFLQMLPHLVHWRVVGFHFAFGNGNGGLDLVTANPAKIVAERFAVL